MVIVVMIVMVRVQGNVYDAFKTTYTEGSPEEATDEGYSRRRLTWKDFGSPTGLVGRRKDSAPLTRTPRWKLLVNRAKNEKKRLREDKKAAGIRQDRRQGRGSGWNFYLFLLST